MNNPFLAFFETCEICQEPRVDTVPRICMIGLLAMLSGMSLVLLMDKLVNPFKYNPVVTVLPFDDESSSSEDLQGDLEEDLQGDLEEVPELEDLEE